MRHVWLALLVALGLSVPAVAAPAVTVLPDRILTGLGNAEFIPRFATYLPNSLTVPAGETVTLTSSVEYDAIEVAGTLRCGGPITLRVTHLTILPGGIFECQQPFAIVVRNVPIDTTRDPYRLGNGLINFGTLRLVGPRAVQLFTTLTADAVAGATTLSLAVPSSWAVGDELMLPDMRQMWRELEVRPRREARVFIAARTATTITLSKPLDFAHESVTDLAGVVKYRPRVANLTRGSSIQSDTPAGTRGHIINIGHDATWDVQHVAFYDLGRTTIEPLDSTTAAADGTITKVGTNQVGRYAFHAHHAQGFGSIFRGGVLINGATAPMTKWAHATHGTHDSLVEDSIALGFGGAGFVVEDGNEVRNVYRGNVAAYTTGNNRAASDNIGLLIGSEGAGFWARGMRNTWTGNEGWDNHIGVNLFYGAQVKGAKIPATPGGTDFVDFDPTTAVPIAFDQNVFLSNLSSGFETWGAPFALLATNVHVAHNGQFAVTAGGGFFGNLWLKNVYSYTRGDIGFGIDVGAGYHFNVTIDGGEIIGSRVGVGNAFTSLTLRDLTLQNSYNILPSLFAVNTFERVMHKPVSNDPPNFIGAGQDAIWNPGDPYPEFATSWLPPFSVTRQGNYMRIINWQGTGQDYLLYHPQSLRSRAAMPSKKWYEMQCPEAGLTTGQCWDRWGMALGGSVIEDAVAVTLPGVNLLARPGLVEPPLGPPITVMTFPTLMVPAVVQDGREVGLVFTVPGDRTSANDVAVVSVDGGPRRRLVNGEFSEKDNFFRMASTTAIAEGAHTVTTWREDLAGQVIPSSERTFQYMVGSGTPPPPPPPSEVCGDGIDNDGDGQVDEGCVVTPPPPPPPVTTPTVTLVATKTTVQVGEVYTLTVAARDGHVVRLDGVSIMAGAPCDGDPALAATTCTKTVSVSQPGVGTKVHTVTWITRDGTAQPPVSVSIAVTAAAPPPPPPPPVDPCVADPFLLTVTRQPTDLAVTLQAIRDSRNCLVQVN